METCRPAVQRQRRRDRICTCSAWARCLGPIRCPRRRLGSCDVRLSSCLRSVAACGCRAAQKRRCRTLGRSDSDLPHTANGPSASAEMSSDVWRGAHCGSGDLSDAQEITLSRGTAFFKDGGLSGHLRAHGVRSLSPGTGLSSASLRHRFRATRRCRSDRLSALCRRAVSRSGFQRPRKMGF